jgi:hypothetical protein
MTVEQFWHQEPKLLNLYQKAYMNDVSFKAHTYGKNNCIAYSIALSNAFASEKDKKLDYPKWESPFDKIQKQKAKITNENLSQKYLEEKISQKQWLNKMLNKKD